MAVYKANFITRVFNKIKKFLKNKIIFLILLRKNE